MTIDPRLLEAFGEAHPEIHVSHAFPLILPSLWQCEYRSASDAQYRRRDGLVVLCSSTRELDGKHWLHVSLSYPNRLPTYENMAACKKLFIGAERVAYQIFSDEKHHVNDHPFVLHLWCCMSGPVTPDFTRGLGTL